MGSTKSESSPAHASCRSGCLYSVSAGSARHRRDPYAIAVVPWVTYWISDQWNASFDTCIINRRYYQAAVAGTPRSIRHLVGRLCTENRRPARAAKAALAGSSSAIADRSQPSFAARSPLGTTTCHPNSMRTIPKDAGLSRAAVACRENGGQGDEHPGRKNA